MHHAKNLHRHNYSDLPIFDLLFGTFYNPKNYENENGFYPGGSDRIWDMLTFKDIAKKVIAENRAPERVNVFEIMTKPVIAVHADMDIRYCARLFSRFHISHAPVVENDKVVGFVSYYLLVLETLPDLD